MPKNHILVYNVCSNKLNTTMQTREMEEVKRIAEREGTSDVNGSTFISRRQCDSMNYSSQS